MVKSEIRPDKINYNEGKVVDDEDIGHASSLYEVELFGIPIQIGIGKEKYTYSAHDVVYYSIYLIIQDEIKSRIGVVEYDSHNVIDNLDEDGDLKLENGNIIYFVGEDYLRDVVKRSEKNDPMESDEDEDEDEDDEDLEVQPLVINDDVVLLDNDPDVTVLEDEDDTAVMRLKIPSDKKTNQIEDTEPDLEDGVFEEVSGVEVPDTLPEETKEMSEQAKTTYKPSSNQFWVSKFMKNENYDIIDNEGRGDCFFAVIRDAFEQLGKKTTVAKLRAIVSDEVTEELFQEYRTLYNSFYGEYQQIESQLKVLKKTGKLLKERSEKTLGKDENKQILDEATAVVERYNNLVADKKDAKQLLNEFDYMKNIDTIDAFKTYIKSNDYWADTWAISTIERVLNVKVVILSKMAYKSGDLDAVLQCGQLNDTDLERQGNFKPDYYIMTSYTGSHYTLITYKDKRIFKFSEVPYDIKALVINKCMERNSGPYYLIQDLRNFKLKLGLNANEGEPQDNEDDYVHSDLYDNNVTFMFHSLSNSAPKPGKGSGENLSDIKAFEYNKLNKMPDWRKKLDDAWISPFTVDDHRWNSVEHYYLGSQFKKGFPDFYHKFSLDSNSEISKDIGLARIAGSKSGKTKTNVLREKQVTIDPDFYEIGVDPRSKTERITAIVAKFNQNLDLKQTLLNTHRAKLIHFVRGREPVVDIDLMKLRRELTSL